MQRLDSPRLHSHLAVVVRPAHEIVADSVLDGPPEEGLAAEARDGAVVHVLGRWLAADPAFLCGCNRVVRLLLLD